MSLAEKLAEHGIRPRSLQDGDQKLTCPRCSHDRRHKTDPCLSLKIDERGATWNCHHCGWGDGFALRSSIPLPPRRPKPVRIEHNPSALPASAIEYFAHRGISESTLEFCGVGWSQQRQAAVFPYRVPGDSAIRNAKFRRLPKDGFSQIAGAEKLYWLIDKAILTEADSLYIVEGEIDALSLIEAGIFNVVSVPNGGGNGKGEDSSKFDFIANCDEWVEPYDKIILAGDRDEKGQAMHEELARRYGKDRCWRVSWPAGCNDANDFLVQYGKAGLAELCRDPEPYPVEGIFTIESYRAEVLSLFFDGNRRGASTGLPSLDEIYTVVRGQLSIVTGVPNHGKSELIDQIMVNLARREGWSFGVCSFENDPPNHISKWAEKWLAMPFWDGPTPRMTSTNLEQALAELVRHFHFIRSEGDEAPTIDWILGRARVLVRRHGIHGLVVDPYNEIEHRRPEGMTETEYVSDMLSKVKRFAAAHDVHVWFVAHPAKMRTEGGKTPVPTLYDISGSANFVNKADCGLVVHRGEQEGTAEVWVRKVRFKWVGRQGKAVLGYNRATGIYSDLGMVSSI